VGWAEWFSALFRIAVRLPLGSLAVEREPARLITYPDIHFSIGVQSFKCVADATSRYGFERACEF
jgi:hypothetical protein